MCAGICYLVTETINENEISHQFKTNKYHEAISDWLLKVRSPISNHVNRSSWQTDVSIAIKSNPTTFKIDGFIDYDVNILDKKTNKLLIKISITTHLYKHISEMTSKGKNIRHYQSSSYLKTRIMIENRIREWVGNDAGAISVLACCASSNPDHIFWLEQGIQNKSLGLEM